MYSLYVNDLEYRYDTLNEAVSKMCQILAKYNLIWFADKGEFKSTSSFKYRAKIKKYIISIKIPTLTLTIFKKEKLELDIESVEYAIKDCMKRYKNNG